MKTDKLTFSASQRFSTFRNTGKTGDLDMQLDRIIGRFEGHEKGPMIICLGGVHGNEPAGTLAMEILFQMIDLEPSINPDFHFCGLLLGLRGNLRAIQAKERFIHADMNRLWEDDNISRIKSTLNNQLFAEEIEVKELLTLIESEIASYQPEKIILLDLHTTTAFGGIFSISTEDPESLHIAIELHAPVIKGMLNGLKGTTLHYFHKTRFEGANTIAVCFESGQHNEELSVNRAIAAIINCMRTVGCVSADSVENRHDKLLIEFSEGLPKVNELITAHTIKNGDGFRMVPNYKNFQHVDKGDLLAHDKHGPIYAEANGRLLMPLYQKQGDDGFFLIKPIEGY